MGVSKKYQQYRENQVPTYPVQKHLLTKSVSKKNVTYKINYKSLYQKPANLTHKYKK